MFGFDLEVACLFVCLMFFQGSNSQKLYFMVLERGPRALIDGTVVLARGCVSDGGASTAMQQYSQLASGYISERINVLSALRSALAVFLSEVMSYNSAHCYVCISSAHCYFSCMC